MDNIKRFSKLDQDLVVYTLMKLTYKYTGGDFVTEFMKQYNILKKSFGIAQRIYSPVELKQDIVGEEEDNIDNYSLLEDAEVNKILCRIQNDQRGRKRSERTM